ncbi:MAG: 6,7-dimethyl-8-ribityllumazine synthase [Pseudomonadota bacterium]
MPKLLIIEARFYEGLADALAEGAEAALREAGAAFDRVSVPGVLEVPAAMAYAVQGGGYDGYVLLGCVIRGETTHYEIVANESARDIMRLASEHRLAVGNGILTVENDAQAWARARLSEKDKGGDAARAALAMIALRDRLGAAS